jgi:hypothetical protein
MNADPTKAPTRAEVAAPVFRVLPAGWTIREERSNGMHVVRGRRESVIVSIERHEHERDGWQLWKHVSLARPDRLPTWAELTEIRDVFMGREALAVQVLAPASEHVNLHRFCLHLWQRLDARAVPDFTQGSGSI